MKKDKQNKGNIKYMMGLLWKGDKFIVCYTFYKQISECIFAAFFVVYMTQYIYTCIEQKTPFNQLFLLVLFMCSVHVLIHFASAGHAYCLKRRTPEIYRYIFTKVIHKSEKMDYKQFERPDFYDKFTRALDECMTRGIDLLWSLANFFASFLGAITAVILVIQVDPMLLVFVVPSIAASFYFGEKTNKAFYEMEMENTRNNRIAAYTKRVFYEKKYAGELRLFSIKNVLLGKHKKAYEELYKTNQKFRKKIALYSALRWFVFVAMSLSIPMIYVAFVVKSNPGISIAPYIAMVTALEFVSGNISDAIDNGIESKKHSLFVKNLRDFLEGKTVETAEKKAVSGSLNDIDINNVSFTYEGAAEPTLHDLNIHIKKGERVAFVGHNGAGKTTFVKLLMGLYEATEGEILVNGENINDFDSTSYHSHFGTVFQDLQVFALPISQNVLMREPLNDSERLLVEQSLEKAQFGDKLAELKEKNKGIDTMVSKEFDDNGVVLSGGETQKIAIARVFAKNPDIVILDEPSSALDPIAEYNMYKNMMELAEDKTVLFISHRLSSARIADKIYMLEQGTVIESGTHDELMEKNEKYAAMFRLQAQNYQEIIPDRQKVN